MNRKYTEENYCKFCGKSLGTGYKAWAKIYCNNTCQQGAQNAERLRIWLETGELPTLQNPKVTKEGETLRSCDRFGAPQALFIRQYISTKQNGLCAICGEPFLWKGKPLTPILDHIDGNGFNNHVENLRLICPNCDSQLDTSKGANRGNGRKSRWAS